MAELEGKVIEVRQSKNPAAIRKIGSILKEIRKLSGLTQGELAARLGIDQGLLSRYESADSDIQFSTVQKFVEALGGKLKVHAAFPAHSALSLSMLDTFDIEINHEDQLVLPIFGDDAFRLHRDVVLSVKPQYTRLIMSGDKTVELRRRFPLSAPRGTIAYIYSTSPERAMVGSAEIADVRKLDVEDIWRYYKTVACISRQDFEGYFEGLHQGYALEFNNVRAFETPVPLEYLRKRFGFEPPQSFLYAKQDLRRALKDGYAVVSN